MGTNADFVTAVEEAVAPILDQDGFELVNVEFILHGRILRLFIDREGGITLEHCTQVSRMVGDMLDAEGISDIISSDYHLEVSSPGLDRLLSKPKDFNRFMGKEVKIKTSRAIDGQRSFQGTLKAASDAGFSVMQGEEEISFNFDDTDWVRLVPEW